MSQITALGTLGKFLTFGSCFALALLANSPRAAEPVPPEMQGVGLDDTLGQTVLQDLTFADEQGRPILLRDLLHKDKPLMLIPVYFSCPTLCNFVLNEFTAGLAGMDWTPPENFEIVTFSIDPKETPALAAAKKQNYLTEYGRPEAAAGWHWLTGQQDPIARLTDSLGFRYKYDADTGQFAHAPAVYVLTPEGEISRILSGLNYNPRDLKLALLEAADGRVGSAFDRLILFCYHYDPDARGYTLFAMRLMRVGGGLTALLLGGLIVGFIVRERRRAGARGGGHGAAPHPSGA